MAGPLSGIRVIEVGQALAGPLAGMIMADMGAEVIKVEKPDGGDDARLWGPPFIDGDALFFHATNRNKKSVTIDIKDAGDVAKLKTLVRGAELVGTPLTAINKIVAASKETAVFNGYCGAESGYVPVSTISPALLTTELELQRSQSAKERAPLIPPPWAKP